ncbi:MAG: hypothetical protein KJO12_01110 [Ignavibacteria bacterium]|nr:hypothetical protein [Ignavibacteria bacterium]
MAQWVNDPGLNAKLVLTRSNPQNISTVTDGLGGGYIVWQDDGTGTDKVYFLHFNSKGKPTLRADGKNISTSGGQQMNPLSVQCIENTSVIMWQGESNKGEQELFVQRVAPNGQLLWNNIGLQITDSGNELLDYSLLIDSNGNSLVSYLSREPGFIGDYIVGFIKINAEGKRITNPGDSLIYRSNNRKSNTFIINDDNNGIFSFWLENVSGKSVLRGLHLDSLELSNLKRIPVNISDPKNNVLSYKVLKYEPNEAYLIWQLQGEEKILYHQLLNDDQKTRWGIYGRAVSHSRGSNTNPQVGINNKNIFVSWTNKLENKQQVFLQRFNSNGVNYWDTDLLLTDTTGTHFGQRMMIDNKDGIITAWFQKKSDSVYADIHALRLSENGEQLWGIGELGIGTYFNSHKSYLSLLPDNSGGAVFVFKDKRDGVYGIYGQRIFSTGTFVSQLVGFSAEVLEDSVNISWHSANEQDSIYYLIERMSQPDNSISHWKLVDSVNNSIGEGVKEYNVKDFPGENGTHYYRVTQKNVDSKEINTDVTRVNYFRVSSEIIVAQNIPNPFSDSTKISFFLPGETEISLKIFSSSLENIYRIDNQLFPKGKNEICFTSDKLEPGIYFYKFEADDFVDVKKMVITK